MTVKQVMRELSAYGSDQTKRIYIGHGAKEPLFGVKIGDMKKLLKNVGQTYDLAKELYDTGNADARYFAALSADEKRMTKNDMRKWARAADWHMLSEYAVAQLISETKQGWDLGLEFIDSKKEKLKCCGWSILSNWISFRPAEEVDVLAVKELLKRLETTIRDQPNRLRFTMCNFVVAAGAFVPEVTKQALATGKIFNIKQPIISANILFGRVNCFSRGLIDILEKTMSQAGGIKLTLSFPKYMPSIKRLQPTATGELKRNGIPYLRACSL